MSKAKKFSLREARTKAGLTIDELAQKADLNYSTCQKIESGRLKGSLTARLKIADALNLPRRLLMTDAEEKFLFESFAKIVLPKSPPRSFSGAVQMFREEKKGR